MDRSILHPNDDLFWASFKHDLSGFSKTRRFGPNHHLFLPQNTMVWTRPHGADDPQMMSIHNQGGNNPDYPQMISQQCPGMPWKDKLLSHNPAILAVDLIICVTFFGRKTFRSKTRTLDPNPHLFASQMMPSLSYFMPR